MKRFAIPVAAAVVGVALACGPTKVEGSLQEILDLTYQDIKLGFAGDQIAVRGAPARTPCWRSRRSSTGCWYGPATS